MASVSSCKCGGGGGYGQEHAVATKASHEGFGTRQSSKVSYDQGQSCLHGNYVT